MDDETLLVKSKVHFTYKENADFSTLAQGDVLEKTEELKKILGEVHPYFLGTEYKYFMVLSQSCDLVRRDGKDCKTPYITLAAIRDYNDFLEKTLIAQKWAENFNGYILIEDKKRILVDQFVERIYNNTESEYFFLYQEDLLNFHEPMVAYLKVSIALKSNLHYQACLNAKRLELSDEFKAKLGWLVGNIYSRVGTTDWDSLMDSTKKHQMFRDSVDSRCLTGSKSQLKELKAKLNDKVGEKVEINDAQNLLSTIVVKSKYDLVIDQIEDALRKTGKHISDDDREKVLADIKSRKIIKNALT